MSACTGNRNREHGAGSNVTPMAVEQEFLSMDALPEFVTTPMLSAVHLAANRREIRFIPSMPASRAISGYSGIGVVSVPTPLVLNTPGVDVGFIMTSTLLGAQARSGRHNRTPSLIADILGFAGVGRKRDTSLLPASVRAERVTSLA
jgi:hypothetical protein